MFRNRFLAKYKLHHLFFWMLVFGFWYYLRFDEYETPEIALLVTLLKVADLALLVYITNYFLIPRFLYRRKYLIFTAGFMVLIAGSAIVKVYALGRILDQPFWLSLSGDLKTRFYENVISDFFLVLAGVAMKLIFDYTKMQQRLSDVAKEKAETELDFLKSQINPHFLFNSLNSVYFLIHKENMAARGALHKFSEMLRYQLYELKSDKIPVEKEIAYLEDYVSLQQLRRDETYAVEFNYSADVKDFLLEPLLLLPFVENAFKHISHNSNTSNFVKINLGYLQGIFYFSILNSREPGIKEAEKNGGIGLVNVKRRLELLYPGRHELKIEEMDSMFSVNLNLKVL